VKRIRSHPLVPVYGYIYDVKCGRLIEVASATEAGKV
jgi:carbonic anhydrase